MPTVSLKLRFPNDAALGPGKIRLLELIAETGSIAAAGRAMKMSYRRAWLLIDELNGMFDTPLVASRLGGAAGGGASLTSRGNDVVRRYRAIEARATTAARIHLDALEGVIARPARRTPPRPAHRKDTA
jgi:molybdate transport system regulatory protein